MPQTREIPCTDCASEKRNLEMGGHTFISCSPVNGKPGMCALVFEFNFPTEAAGAAKKKKATTKKRASKKARK